MDPAPQACAPVPPESGRSGQARWRWYSEFQPRLFELSSPHSPAECGRRLEARTTQRRAAVLLGSFSARKRLFGWVSPAGIRVSRLADGGHYSYLRPWFHGRIGAAPDGGTVLRGSVGPSPTALRGFLAFLVAEGAGCVYFAANGLDALLSGNPGMRNGAQRLLQELDYTLRSTSG